MRKKEMMSGHNIKQCIFLLLAIICSALIISGDRDAFNQEQVEHTETFIMESSELVTEMTEVSQENEEIVEEVEEVITEPDPFPTYPFHIEEVTVQLSELKKDYKLAWVSDLHIIADIPFSEENTDVAQSSYEMLQNRYDNTFITEDGVHPRELWAEIVNWLNVQNLDGVILGGDMLDYYSRANMEVFTKEYERIKAPVMYLRADHDYEIGYSERLISENDARQVHESLDGNLEAKYFNFPEFTVFGINDSYKSISGIAWEFMEYKLREKKPMLFVSHVPYASEVEDSLKELSLELRGKEYYWTSDTYQPNELQYNLLEEIYNPAANIRQIFAGHLHETWDGRITDTVSEHIFGPAYAGNIGIINVVSK